MRNTLLNVLGVAGLLLAAACADPGSDPTTQPGDGEITLDGCKIAGCNNEVCLDAGDRKSVV
jgi:hypothetical protein